MEHFYQNLEGWTHFAPFYFDVVKQAKENSHFVEVGSWKGKSASLMGVEIINSGKKIKFDCVDTWNGSEEHLDPNNWAFEPNLSKPDWLYNLFLENTKPIKEYINPIRLPSLDACKLYEDKSLDFVFIDAAHDYENVCKDIDAWLPKIKKGGILAGDDIQSGNDIERAVKEKFGDDFIDYGYSVWVKKC